MVRRLRFAQSRTVRRKPSRVSVSTKAFVKRSISRSKETKILFTTRNLSNQNSTMTALDCTDIDQGDDDDNRIGDKVLPMSLSVGVHCQANTGAADSSIRILVVSTRVEGTPVALDFLNIATDPGVIASRYTLSSPGSVVLFDKVVDLTTAVTAENRSKRFNFFIRKGLGPLEFDSASVTTAKKNKIYIMTVGSLNATPPAIEIHAVLKYKDM